MIKIVHIITGISTGGAQMMLYKLLSSMDKAKFESIVVVLLGDGKVGRRIEELGIPVHRLEMSRGRASLSALWRLISTVRMSHPDIVQGWMYHGNLASLVVKVFISSHPPVIWNIRQALYCIEDEKPLTRLVIRICKYLSEYADRIVYNSKLSAKQHETFGFRSDFRVLLPNGFDVKKFFPSDVARNVVRQSLGIGEYTPVVGLFARYHPMKDHINFIHAARIVNLQRPDTQYILVGRGVSLDNPEMCELVNTTEVKKNFHLLGERSDIPELMNSIDGAVLSSYAEAFPNVLGEAMACGIPCVVTDVGDSAWVLGMLGKVVPARDPKALAGGMLQLLNLGEVERKTLGRRARQRIVEKFSLDRITAQYESMYMQVFVEHNAKN